MSGQPNKPVHFYLLSQDNFQLWVPKGMTFTDNIVKVIAVPFRGKQIVKVSTAEHMEGEGCGQGD